MSDAMTTPVSGTPVSGSVGGRVPRVRKAHFRLTRIDPWSVMKTAFLFSVAFGIITWVSVYVVWAVIGASGIIEAINQALRDILSTPTDKNPVRVEDFINTNKVMGLTTIVSVVNIVFSTALATLFAFLYNLSANIFGGLEVTLNED